MTDVKYKISGHTIVAILVFAPALFIAMQSRPPQTPFTVPLALTIVAVGAMTTILVSGHVSTVFRAVLGGLAMALVATVLYIIAGRFADTYYAFRLRHVDGGTPLNNCLTRPCGIIGGPHVKSVVP